MLPSARWPARPRSERVRRRLALARSDRRRGLRVVCGVGQGLLGGGPVRAPSRRCARRRLLPCQPGRSQRVRRHPPGHLLGGRPVGGHVDRLRDIRRVVRGSTAPRRIGGARVPVGDPRARRALAATERTPSWRAATVRRSAPSVPQARPVERSTPSTGRCLRCASRRSIDAARASGGDGAKARSWCSVSRSGRSDRPWSPTVPSEVSDATITRRRGRAVSCVHPRARAARRRAKAMHCRSAPPAGRCWLVAEKSASRLATRTLTVWRPGAYRARLAAARMRAEVDAVRADGRG